MNFEKRLIQLIRDNDMLYNYYHPFYNKIPLRLEVWTKIAHQLGIEAKEAQKRWQNLRRVFKRIRIKIRQTGRLPRRTWRHYDDMDFIREFDPTPGEQTIVDLKKQAVHELPLNDDIKFEEYDEVSSFLETSDNCIDQQKHDSEILHSIKIEHVPEEAPQSIETTIDDTQQDHKTKSYNDTKPAMPSKTRKKHTHKLSSTCSQNLFVLGSKVDAIAVPQRLKFELERKVADLVYEVLNEYSADY